MVRGSCPVAYYTSRGSCPVAYYTLRGGLLDSSPTATYHILRCSLIWYIHMDTHPIDPAHKIYQYSLKTAPWGLKHVALHSVNKVMLTCTVHWWDFYGRLRHQCTNMRKIKLTKMCWWFNSPVTQFTNWMLGNIQFLKRVLLRLTIVISEFCT
jgi:hypothetical protein